MLNRIEGLPDNVVAFSASGQVTGEDYENALMPALGAAHEQHDKIRLLFELGEEFEGYEGEAAWDDAKVGLKYFTAFDKAAVVSDNHRVVRAVKTFGFMMPGEIRLFANSDLEAAKSWVTE